MYTIFYVIKWHVHTHADFVRKIYVHMHAIMTHNIHMHNRQQMSILERDTGHCMSTEDKEFTLFTLYFYLQYTPNIPKLMSYSLKRIIFRAQKLEKQVWDVITLEHLRL